MTQTATNPQPKDQPVDEQIKELAQEIYFYGDWCAQLQSMVHFGKYNVERRNREIRESAQPIIDTIEKLCAAECNRARIEELKKIGCCDYWEDSCELNVCRGEQLDRIAELQQIMKEGES